MHGQSNDQSKGHLHTLSKSTTHGSQMSEWPQVVVAFVQGLNFDLVKIDKFACLKHKYLRSSELPVD